MTFSYSGSSAGDRLVAMTRMPSAMLRERKEATEEFFTRIGRHVEWVGDAPGLVLLGIVLLFTWPYYPALIGHIVMMLLASGVPHVFSFPYRLNAVVAGLALLLFPDAAARALARVRSREFIESATERRGAGY